jgi:cytoskeletal protein RodZ
MNLGELLKSAREDSGLSLEDLAAAISIRPGLLGEIERNNFIHCGGDIYSRGHLRNIAPFIGQDPLHLIELYNSEHSLESRSINEMLAENSVTKVPHEKKSLSWKVPAAISISILLVIGVVQIVMSNSVTTQSPQPIASAEASAETTSIPTPESTPESTPEPTSGVVTDGVKLSITASRGNSRIDIVIDGKHVEKGSIFQGETKSYSSDTSISVYFSNPAGLDVTVDGILLEPLGGQNQEVRRTFR